MPSALHTKLMLTAFAIAGAFGATPVLAADDVTTEVPARSLAASLPRVAEPAASDLSTLAEGARERGFMSEILPTAAALGGTLLVIVLTRSAIKRFGGNLGPGKRPSGVVEVLARYPVARGQQVVLLKVGRRVLVVHQGAQAMQTLSEFSAAEDVADLITRCEAGSKNAKDASRDFSFDALLKTAGSSFEEDVRAGRAAGRIDPRDALPAVMRGAEIETVDLTRGRKDGRRGGSR